MKAAFDSALRGDYIKAAPDYTLERDRSTRAADGHAPGSAAISARPRDLPAPDPSVP